MSHLPGKKRSDDINRHLKKKMATDSTSDEQLPKESEGNTPVEREAKLAERMRPSSPARELASEPVVHPTADDLLADMEDLSPRVDGSAQVDEEQIASKGVKTFGSGEVQFTELEGITADERLENEWAEPDETVEEKSNLTSIVIFALIGIALLISGLAVSFKLLKKENEQSVNKRKIEAQRIVTQKLNYQEANFDEEERAEVEAIYDDIVAKLKGFLVAETVEERAEFIRHKDRVLPLMRKYYETNEFESYKTEDFRVFQPVTLEGKAFWVTSLEYEDKNLPVLVEQTPENEVWIDWETFVTYQNQDWGEMLKARPEGSHKARVRVARASYNVYEFADEAKWASVILVGRDSEEEIYGFYRKDAEFATRLTLALSRASSVNAVSIIADLTFPQDSRTRNCCVIEDVESWHWVYVEDEASGK